MSRRSVFVDALVDQPPRNIHVIGDMAEVARAHPLIIGLIETLPPPGSDFSPEKRTAWLDTMGSVFTLIYGEVQEKRLRTSAAPPRRSTSARPSDWKEHLKPKTKAKTKPKSRKAAPKSAPLPSEFYVDMQGFARNAANDRILPEDVNDVLYDRRGEVDFGTIIWADGTRGVPRGMQLDISAVPK